MIRGEPRRTSPSPDTPGTRQGCRKSCRITYQACSADAHYRVRYNHDGSSDSSGGRFPDEASLPIVIATILRGDGITGVDTHIRQLRGYLAENGTGSTLVTPFSWGRALAVPVFGLRRLVLERCWGPANVVWYRHWHEVFLRNALRRCLAEVGDCVVYAQDPLAARAVLRVRRGPHQRVVMAVHFRISQADEWADKKL